MSSSKQITTDTIRKFDKSPGLKFKYSLYSALAFFFLASPQMFSFVNSNRYKFTNSDKIRT